MIKPQDDIQAYVRLLTKRQKQFRTGFVKVAWGLLSSDDYPGLEASTSKRWKRKDFGRLGLEIMINRYIDMPITEDGKINSHSYKLDHALQNRVRFFMEEDEISLLCIRSTEEKKVKIEGSYVMRRRRVLIYTRKECYGKFKVKYPDEHLSLSRFHKIIRDFWLVLN